jgi:cephalosporin-C deacetylase
MPDYASVHDIIYTSLRHKAVVMNPTYRGQRNSDGQVRAAYPGLLTDGIESPETYTLLGAYADALRAVDALLTQSEASIGTIALTGTGLGANLALAVAARRSSVAAVAADTPMALGHSSALQLGLGYPLGELDDYVRAHPERRDAIAGTLSSVNPMGYATTVQVPVLMSAGRFDRSLCPLTFAQELAEALPDCDLRVYDGASEGGGHEHGQVRGAWLAEKLDIPAP